MNNPFDAKYGLPGSRVMDGMNAAIQMNNNYDSMMSNYMNVLEQRRNMPLLELQRQISSSNLNTALPITEESNRVLGILNKNRDIATGADYARVKSEITGKNYQAKKNEEGQELLYQVQPDGSLVAPQPIYTGNSARNNLVMGHARNLMGLEGLIPGEQQQQANVALQLAMQENNQYNKGMQEQLDLYMKMMQGLVAGRSGGKSGSGSGSDSGVLDMYKLSGADYEKALQTAQTMALEDSGLFLEKGQLMYKDSQGVEMPATAQQVQDFKDAREQYLADFGNTFARSGDFLDARMGATSARAQRQNFGAAALQDLAATPIAPIAPNFTPTIIGSMPTRPGGGADVNYGVPTLGRRITGELPPSVRPTVSSAGILGAMQQAQQNPNYGAVHVSNMFNTPAQAAQIYANPEFVQVQNQLSNIPLMQLFR